MKYQRVEDFVEFSGCEKERICFVEESVVFGLWYSPISWVCWDGYVDVDFLVSEIWCEFWFVSCLVMTMSGLSLCPFAFPLKLSCISYSGID